MQIRITDMRNTSLLSILSPAVQQKIAWWLSHYAVPIIISALMIGAPFMVWISDPLGSLYTAWHLPIDIGWQIHANEISYGLLCVLSAIYLLYRVAAHWLLRHDVLKQSRYPVITKFAGLLCLAPLLLFFFQYMFADIQGIDVLAQHETQMLLIQQHFGYNTLSQVLPLKPFTASAGSNVNIVSSTTLIGRLNLIVDLAGPGVLLPLISGITGLLRGGSKSAADDTPPVPFRERFKNNWVTILVVGVPLLVIFGRAPAAMASEYQAKQSLSVGDYAGAMNWLNEATMLNPALSQETSYHLERGRADYYLQPNKLTDDAHVYLSSVYSAENDYIDAYSELLGVWRSHITDNEPWLTEQFSMTLEWLAEFSQRTSAQPVMGIDGLPVDKSMLALTRNPTGLIQDNSNAAIQSTLSNNGNQTTVGGTTMTPGQQADALTTSPLSPDNNLLAQQNGSSVVTQQAQNNNSLSPVVPRTDGDFSAIPWLTMLSEVDSANVYGQYVLGREFYGENSYNVAIKYMQVVLDINQSPNIQSSADTYIGLSMIQQGQVAQGRALLIQATKLDVNFNNNTAREELSGLH